MVTPLPRVLLVDDEPLVVEALMHHLRKRFEVATANSGAEGLRIMAEQGPFAAVISDFAMPSLNGLEFLAQARQNAPDTMRILLTGQASLEHAIAAVNTGHIFRFFTKPCSAKTLLEALDEAVAHRESLLQSRAADAQKFEAMSEQLQRAERLASLGTMAGAVGHELSNALTPLYGAMDYIRRDVANGRLPQDKHLDTLRHAQEHLSTHARNLLNLGRPSADGSIPSTDLTAAVRAVVELLRASGVLKRVRVKVDAPFVPVMVPVGRTEVQQVLVNLVKNAAEALDEAGTIDPEVRIVVALGAAPGIVDCRVSDNGNGIPAAKLPFLFEPYYTTKPPDRGTGLGLFVVSQIVRRAGGEMSVDSVEGHGATFTMTLPVRRAPRHER